MRAYWYCRQSMPNDDLRACCQARHGLQDRLRQQSRGKGNWHIAAASELVSFYEEQQRFDVGRRQSSWLSESMLQFLTRKRPHSGAQVHMIQWQVCNPQLEHLQVQLEHLQVQLEARGPSQLRRLGVTGPNVPVSRAHVAVHIFIIARTTGRSSHARR